MVAPALILAAPHGIVAVAWAHAAVSLFDTTVRLLVARHYIAVSLRDIGRQLLVAYRGGVVMAAVAAPVLWATSGLGNLISLAVTVPLAAIVYLGVLARYSRNDLRRILGWVGLGRLVRHREAT